MQFTHLIIPALLAVAFPAMSQTVNLSGFTYTPAITGNTYSSTTPALNGSYLMGQFSGLLDGASFLTYCLEVPQAPLFNSNVSYTAGMSWDTTTAMSRAYTWVTNTLQPYDAPSSGLAQAVLWEVLYETSGTYDLAAGNFKVASAWPLTPVDWSYIADASKLGAFTVLKLENATYQDLLLAQPIPEVETYALMLAGLAGVGFVARRRRPR